MLKTERISLTVTCPLMRVGLKLCLQPLCKNLFPAYGFIFIKKLHYSFFLLLLLHLFQKDLQEEKGADHKVK